MTVSPPRTFTPPFLPKKDTYTPTHPGVFHIQFADEGEFNSCLKLDKAFKKGDTIAEIKGTQPGTKGKSCTYSTVQVLPDPPVPNFKVEDESQPRHIELMSDLLYVNHSCDPNVAFDVRGSPGDWKVAALKDLDVGDVLTFAYFSSEWHMDQPFVCQCGSEKCLGTIRGAEHIEQDVLSKSVETYFVNDHILAMKAHQIATASGKTASTFVPSNKPATELQIMPAKASPPTRSKSSRRSDATSAATGDHMSRLGQNSQANELVAIKQQHERPAQAPIRFYDDEVRFHIVARMHEELEQQRQAELYESKNVSRAVDRKLKSERASTSGLLLRGFLLYTIVSWLAVCPNERHETDKQAICHAFDYTESAVKSLNVHLKPYTDIVWRQAQPYIAHVQQTADPYVKLVRPYYHKADQTARYVLKQRQHLHDKYVQPRVDQATTALQQAQKPVVHALDKQYRKTLAPSVEWYSREYNEWYKNNAEAHVRQAEHTLQSYSSKVHEFVAPAWTRGWPFVRKHFRETVVPITVTSSKTVYSGYVNEVHPRLVAGSRHGVSFLRARVLPALQRFWSVFIAPQLDKISEKVHEYRVRKVRQTAEASVDEAEKKVFGNSDDVEEFIAELRDIPNEPAITATGTSSPVPESTLSPAERKALNAEKRAALQSLQTSYEKEMLKLGDTEHGLLTSRLVELRKNAVDDVPKRFNPLLVHLDEESDKMVARFEKYFERAKAETTHSPDKKIAEAELLGKQAIHKIRKLADNVILEVRAYRDQLDKRELRAASGASEALDALLAKAQEELGYGWTWLDDVSHKDWQRYHGLSKAVKNWKTNFDGLRAGDIEDEALAGLDAKKLLQQVETQASSVVANFVTVLDRRVELGKRELRGEWTGMSNEAVKAYDAAADTVSVAFDAVKSSASSLAGVQPPPTDVAGSASSIASVASSAANSYANVVGAAVSDGRVYDSVKSVFGDASQSVLEAVGVEASPTDLRQSAASVARSAARAARSASIMAEAALADASQSIIRAVGGEPRPTDARQHATSVVKAARASVESAYAGVTVGSEASSSASSLVDEARRSVVKAAGDISQTIVRAVGSEPSPTDVAQRVTSAAKVAQSVLSQQASGAREQAQQVVSKASSVASDAASQASSVLHDVTRTTAEGISESASSVAQQVKSAVDEHVPHIEL
ncbi:hypothetical protein OIV83_004024 [Microbotryomycetes sp. JL201]|nr:hypothetical protein OIV83_004024 [Microbotryomycetes sp. JL201]